MARKDPRQPTKPSRGKSAAGSQRSAKSPDENGGASATPEERAAEHHAQEQRIAHSAEVLDRDVFPALMADSLGLEKIIDFRAYKVFLDNLIRDAGSPSDPIEIMMLQQLALAHFRIGRLQAGASLAEGNEATKIYNAAAARMLGEFRRTALALRAYRGRSPDVDDAGTKLKVYKEAQ